MPSSDHLMDPELARALEGMPSFDYSAENISVMRPLVAGLTLDAPPAPGTTTREQFIEGPDGNEIRLLVSEPADGPRTGTLLWLHGGGQIVGSSDGYAAQNRHFAQQSGAVVIAVDYRLAPEHPYPAGLEDCYAVLRGRISRLPSGASRPTASPWPGRAAAPAWQRAWPSSPATAAS